MNRSVSVAVLGLQRAVSAVGQELTAIRQARPRVGFPHAELVAALPAAQELEEAADDFIGDLLELAGDHTANTLKNTAKSLAILHAAATKLHSTVEWSSDFTGLDWWVARRTAELGLSRKRILIAPGALDQFQIETFSHFARHLTSLGGPSGMLAAEDGLAWSALDLDEQDVWYERAKADLGGH